MSTIEFTTEEKQSMVLKLQQYFEAELEHEIGQFDAEFLIDFFSSKIGPYYYNRGLQDARTILQTKIDSIDEDFYAAEKDIK